MRLFSRVRTNLVKKSLDPHARPVLVVEDDAGVRAYIVAVLEHQGYRVVAAGSGEEALVLLGDQPAQLAVLDLGLPGMDGIAVKEQLADDVPVIIVTGDPEKARARDPNLTVLPKPVAPDVLERAVADAL
jgi:CheY-like chemotaxis protein